jgi:predicted Zn-dependent protease
MASRFVALLTELAIPFPAIGVTSVELRDCRGTPVNGLAERSGRVGFVSYRRISGLSASDQLGGCLPTLSLAWTALHESGHLAGLGHCGALGCAMQVGAEVSPESGRCLLFCPACARRWRDFTAE